MTQFILKNINIKRAFRCNAFNGLTLEKAYDLS